MVAVSVLLFCVFTIFGWAAVGIGIMCCALYNLYKGNTAQRTSGDFARHLLANFPSYFTKILVNTASIHSAFCFI